MANSKRALTEIRDVDVTITGQPMPVDAYKAITGAVERFESLYEGNLDEDGAFVAGDLVNVTVAAPMTVTGTLPFKLYSFDYTANYATGVYTFAYLGLA